MVMFTNGSDARRAVAALLPLARAGALDEHISRILLLRAQFLGSP
jgi:hypothetical protein